MTYTQPPTSSPPPSAAAGDSAVLSATRARQGRFGRHMFLVLIASTLLAALGLLAAWVWKGHDLASVEHNNAKQPVLSQSFDAPAPATQPAPTGQARP